MSRNTPRVLCVFVIIPLSHGSAESVDQSMDGVCRSNLPVPFQTSQSPNGGVLRDECGSVRLLRTCNNQSRQWVSTLVSWPFSMAMIKDIESVSKVLKYCNNVPSVRLLPF